MDCYTSCLLKHLNKTAGVLQIPKALEYFKADYVSQSSERRDITQKLVYDVSLAAKQNTAGT